MWTFQPVRFRARLSWPRPPPPPLSLSLFLSFPFLTKPFGEQRTFSCIKHAFSWCLGSSVVSVRYGCNLQREVQRRIVSIDVNGDIPYACEWARGSGGCTDHSVSSASSFATKTYTYTALTCLIGLPLCLSDFLPAQIRSWILVFCTNLLGRFVHLVFKLSLVSRCCKGSSIDRFQVRHVAP